MAMDRLLTRSFWLGNFELVMQCPSPLSVEDNIISQGSYESLGASSSACTISTCLSRGILARLYAMANVSAQEIAAESAIVWTTRFAWSATCFVMYDTLLQMEDEVTYIWSQKNSYVKWAYMFIRHVPYLTQISILALISASLFGHSWHPDQCRSMIIYHLALNEALTIAIEAVLIIRIYAMFDRNRIIIAMVLLLFAMEISGMIAILAISIPKIQFTSGCIMTHTPAIFTSYWIVSLCFETLLFGMTLIKFFISVTRRLGRQSIMYVLVRDGTWAFGVIFVVMLLNSLFYKIMPNTLDGLWLFWELSAISFVGSRVLLNLRRFAAQDSILDESISAAGNTSSVVFRSHVTHSSPQTLRDRDMGQNVIELHETRDEEMPV